MWQLTTILLSGSDGLEADIKRSVQRGQAGHQHSAIAFVARWETNISNSASLSKRRGNEVDATADGRWLGRGVIIVPWERASWPTHGQPSRPRPYCSAGTWPPCPTRPGSLIRYRHRSLQLIAINPLLSATLVDHLGRFKVSNKSSRSLTERSGGASYIYVYLAKPEDNKNNKKIIQWALSEW